MGHHFIPLSKLPIFYSIAPHAGVLVLGAADSMASIVGIYFGKTKWKGTKKTLEGTVGATLTLFACVFFLIYLYDIRVSVLQYAQVFMACTFTCLLEALTEQNDNLFLP